MTVEEMKAALAELGYVVVHEKRMEDLLADERESYRLAARERELEVLAWAIARGRAQLPKRWAGRLMSINNTTALNAAWTEEIMRDCAAAGHKIRETEMTPYGSDKSVLVRNCGECCWMETK